MIQVKIWYIMGMEGGMDHSSYMGGYDTVKFNTIPSNMIHYAWPNTIWCDDIHLLTFI